MNKTNKERPTELDEGLNNDINVDGPSVVDKTSEEGTKTGLEEELRDVLDINLGDDNDVNWLGEDREDSALDITFGDSEEEVGDE